MVKRIVAIPLVFIIVLSLVFVSCKDELSADDQKLLNDAKAAKEKNAEQLSQKGEILDVMKQVYLWYDKLNPHDTTLNEDPETFYYSMLYRAFDKWSFMLTMAQYNDFVNARYFGHGFRASVDENGDMRVTFVFKNTTAYNKGLRRGWKFVTVNGNTPLNADHLYDLLGSDSVKNTNTMVFEKPDNSIVTFTLTKEEINSNPVLETRILDVDNKKVGYISLESFVGDSALVVNEYNKAFSYFNENNISELVVDLRYNGGGALDFSQLFANLIIGNYKDNFLFVSESYNNLIDNFVNNKSSSLSRTTNSLNKQLNRVFFITNNETASASEMLIACLQPYIEVQLVGTKTAGKPVGMKSLKMEKSDYILVPIMFQWKNSQKQSISYNGIPVNKLEFDDLTHEQGDPQEACLAQVINYIKTGSYMATKKSFREIPSKNTTGYRALLNAY